MMRVLILIIAFALISCSQSTNNPESSNETNAEFTKCLTGEGSAIEETASTTINWSFDNNILKIDHINAGFNCCFDVVIIKYEVSDNAIEIIEREIGQPCDCLCPRDINYDLIGIDDGLYTVTIIEAVGIDDFLPVEFEADLRNGNSGTISFDRPEYPFGLRY